MKNNANFDFGIVYDGLNNNYTSLESVMANIYSNPNMSKEEILMQLGEVASSMLSLQIELTDRYGEPGLKESLISNLSNKQEVIKDSLSQTNGRGK